MDLPTLIRYLKEKTEWFEKERENMDAASWNYQEGILITGNEAKLLLEFYEKHSQPRPPGPKQDSLTIKTQ